MGAGGFIVCHPIRERIGNGEIDFDTDSFSYVLLSSTSNISTSSDGYASLTGELSTANGYTNGGYSVTPTWTRSGGKVTFDVSDPTWTASGGSITARWGAIIDTTAGRVVAYHLLESPAADVTTSAGNILTVKINVAGVFVIDD